MILFDTSYSNSNIIVVPSSYQISFFDRRTHIMTDDLTDLPLEVNTFKALPPFAAKFDVVLRMYRQSGRLVYDYNPFHNLILSVPREPLDKNGTTYYFKEGDVYDFDIDLSRMPFNLKNPVNIEIQPSYDGSVNVIAYDNLNNAYMVNSRFSVEELDTYRIIDRRGNNDTNLYEELYLENQTKLYKTSNIISQIDLEAIETGGTLSVGSYVVYFKYTDADGNETDVIAESGVIPIFVGNINDPKSIRGGMVNEVTDKLIKVKITNIDPAYDYITLYYVRNTSDYTKLPIQQAYKVTDKYVLNSRQSEIILTISGYEQIQEITLEEIVQLYNTVDRQKTMAQVQNRLFQANVGIDRNDYRELEDLSLHFIPTIRSRHNIGNLNHKYEPLTADGGLEYYNPLNLYNHLGYWDKEIYRFGVVYITENNRLSPVFNVRGGLNISEIDFDNVIDEATYASLVKKAGNGENTYTYFSVFKQNEAGDTVRNYIPVGQNKEIINNQDATGNHLNENAAGVVNIYHSSGPIRSEGVFPLGIQFSIDKQALLYLKSLGVKGYFFVRQKRIPNILFQGVTQGYSTELEIPAIYMDMGGIQSHKVELIAHQHVLDDLLEATGLKEDGTPVQTWNAGGLVYALMNDKDSFLKRLKGITEKSVEKSGTIYSPDLALNTELMGDLLVGNELRCTYSKHQFLSPAMKLDSENERHFYNEKFQNYEVPENPQDIKAILVEDSTPVKFSGKRRYRGRCGQEDEAWRFESVSKTPFPLVPAPKDAVRGYFGTYAGLELSNAMTSGTYLDIHIPEFSWEHMPNYFKVRYNSFQSYHAITNKFDLDKILANENKPFWTTEAYRGDCFIGNYTQRVHRNFADPEVPLNDIILGNTKNPIDPLYLMSSFGVWFAEDGILGIPYIEDNYLYVNRADVNAVQLGHWITFKACSNTNLIYRGIDKRHVDEFNITGTNRSFYPIAELSTTSELKHPESSIVNGGYSLTLPPSYYIINPDVPYLQDKFNNRIMFSDVHVNDSFRNGYRVFKGLDYQDYNLGYGAIVKIIEWNNNLMVVFEHGIGVVPINENTMLSGENTGEVYLRGINVLPKTMNVISDTYGSQWLDSVVKTSRYVYGFDHTAKKIWRTNGQLIELISDFKVQKFLNDHITLNLRENTPTFGIRNIKTHYNAFKEDVMFTYYDVDSIFNEKKWNLCYNEQLGKWTTRYSWEPVTSVSINNIYFSYDRESSEKIVLLSTSYVNATNSLGIVLSHYEMNPDTIIEMSIKSDVLEKYFTKMYIDWGEDLTGYDNHLFNLIEYTENGILKYQLVPKNFYQLLLQNKFLYSLRIKATLYKKDDYLEEYDSIYDVVHIRILRDNYSNILKPGFNSPRKNFDIFYTTRFWKHGQAGIFFLEGEILPTTWYGKTMPFEFEFIVNEQPMLHKIISNLIIVSNNAEPDSITYTVDNDTYSLLKLPLQVNPLWTEYSVNRMGQLLLSGGLPILEEDIDYTTTSNRIVTTMSLETLKLYQKTINTKNAGRLLGNMHYKENYWYVDIAPLTIISREGNIPKQALVRDKQIKVRIKYTGNKLAVITALTTIFIQSYA